MRALCPLFTTHDAAIQHSSGLCVGPFVGANATLGASAVLSTAACTQHRYLRLSNEAIKHSTSGLCLVPAGINATFPPEGAIVAFSSECSDAAVAAWHIKPSGAVEHLNSGRCWQLSNASETPAENTGLIVGQNCSTYFAMGQCESSTCGMSCSGVWCMACAWCIDFLGFGIGRLGIGGHISARVRC